MSKGVKKPPFLQIAGALRMEAKKSSSPAVGLHPH